MKLKNVNPNAQQMYVTWGDDSKSKEDALRITSNALQSYQRTNISIGSGTYRNIIPNISIREGLSRKDYEQYRSVEGIPEDDPKEIKRACQAAYKRIGIVRNVIDMMADFVVKNIRVVHPTRAWEKLGEEWAKIVNLHDRSERFANLLIRQATVIIKRSTARLPPSSINKIQRGMASTDIVPKLLDKPEPGVIPWRYTFINPLAVEITDDPLGDPLYWLRVNAHMSKRIFGTAANADSQMVALLPPELKTLAQKERLIRLDPEKTRVFHYKKDDWELWGTPFIYSILDDLIAFEKMKLADITALDGAISHIRVWKLGDIKEKLMPTPAAVARLADMLANAGNGGTMDLIWSADLTLEETSTEVHNFLGDTKYKPILENIYSGLGIPPTLTGSSGNSGGFTNNFISLRTLTERLMYVRQILIEFWEHELKLFQLAVGAKKPFHVEFDHMTLTDEAAEKALLIQLADRNIIPLEAVQRRFGEIPEISTLRIRRQQKQRKSGKLPPQAGPFHVAEKEHDLNKIALQTGVATPKGVGLELDEDNPLDEPIAVKQVKVQKEKQKGISGQGRPKNKKDKAKRKQKRVTPRTSAFTTALSWAKTSQDKIDEIITPIYLENCCKANLRQLTTKEFEQLEKLKFTTLANLTPLCEVDKVVVQSILSQENLAIPSRLIDLRNKSIASFVNRFGKEPILKQIRDIEANIIGICVFQE